MSEPAILGQRYSDPVKRREGIAVGRVEYLDHPTQVFLSTAEDGDLHSGGWSEESDLQPVVVEAEDQESFDV